MNKALDFLRICFVVAVIAGLAFMFWSKVAETKPIKHNPVPTQTVQIYDYQLLTK